MANLIDLYGAERAVFLSAWVALAIADRVQQGLVEGIAFDDTTMFLKLVADGLEAGQELPTDEEFRTAVSAVVVSYPSIAATPKGRAFAAFQQMQEGAGQG